MHSMVSKVIKKTEITGRTYLRKNLYKKNGFSLDYKLSGRRLKSDGGEHFGLCGWAPCNHRGT